MRAWPTPFQHDHEAEVVFEELRSKGARPLKSAFKCLLATVIGQPVSDRASRCRRSVSTARGRTR